MIPRWYQDDAKLGLCLENKMISEKSFIINNIWYGLSEAPPINIIQGTEERKEKWWLFFWKKKYQDTINIHRKPVPQTTQKKTFTRKQVNARQRVILFPPTLFEILGKMCFLLMSKIINRIFIFKQIVKVTETYFFDKNIENEVLSLISNIRAVWFHEQINLKTIFEKNVWSKNTIPHICHYSIISFNNFILYRLKSYLQRVGKLEKMKSSDNGRGWKWSHHSLVNYPAKTIHNHFVK